MRRGCELDGATLLPTKKGGGYGKIFGIGVGGFIYLRPMALRLFLIGIGMYVLGVLTYGVSRASNIRVLVYFKPIRQPFFRMGLSYDRAVYEDVVVDTLCIGMFIVNVDIDFEWPTNPEQ